MSASFLMFLNINRFFKNICVVHDLLAKFYDSSSSGSGVEGTG